MHIRTEIEFKEVCSYLTEDETPAPQLVISGETTYFDKKQAVKIQYIGELAYTVRNIISSGAVTTGSRIAVSGAYDVDSKVLLASQFDLLGKYTHMEETF